MYGFVWNSNNLEANYIIIWTWRINQDVYILVVCTPVRTTKIETIWLTLYFHINTTFWSILFVNTYLLSIFMYLYFLCRISSFYNLSIFVVKQKTSLCKFNYFNWNECQTKVKDMLVFRLFSLQNVTNKGIITSWFSNFTVQYQYSTAIRISELLISLEQTSKIICRRNCVLLNWIKEFHFYFIVLFYLGMSYDISYCRKILYRALWSWIVLIVLIDP